MSNPSPANESTSKFSTLKSSLQRIIALYIENAKLTAAEKLTLLFSAAVTFTVCFILAAIALTFIAIALLELLELAVSPIIAATIMACLFLLLSWLIYLLRKQLIVNPTARFISKLIMDIGKKRFND
jgi:hypothetical protein